MRRRRSERGVIFLIALFVVAITGLTFTTGMTRGLSMVRAATRSLAMAKAMARDDAVYEVAVQKLVDSAYDDWPVNQSNLIFGSCGFGLSSIGPCSNKQYYWLRAERRDNNTNALWRLQFFPVEPNGPAIDIWDTSQDGDPVTPVAEAIVERPNRRLQPPNPPETKIWFPAALYATDLMDLDETKVYGDIMSKGKLEFGHYTRVHGNAVSFATQTDGGANLTPTIKTPWGGSTVWGSVQASAIFSGAVELDYLSILQKVNDPDLPLPGSTAGADIQIGVAGTPATAINILNASRVDCNGIPGCTGQNNGQSHLQQWNGFSTGAPVTESITPTDIPLDAPAGNSGTCTGQPNLVISDPMHMLTAAEAAVTYCDVIIQQSNTLTVPTGLTLNVMRTIDHAYYSALQVDSGAQVKTWRLHAERSTTNADLGSTVAIRDWDIHGGSKVTLPGGHYQADRVYTTPGASNPLSITFTGSTTWYIRGTLDPVSNTWVGFEHGGHTTIAPSSNKIEDLTIALVTDPVNGGAPYTYNSQDLTLIGSIYGPDSLIDLRNHPNIYGAIVGKTILLTNGPEVFMQAQGYVPGPIKLKAWRELNPN